MLKVLLRKYDLVKQVSIAARRLARGDQGTVVSTKLSHDNCRGEDFTDELAACHKSLRLASPDKTLDLDALLELKTQYT